MILGLVIIAIGAFVLYQALEGQSFSFFYVFEEFFIPAGLISIIVGLIITLFDAYSDSPIVKQPPTAQVSDSISIPSKKNKINGISLIVTDINYDSTIVKSGELEIHGKFESTIGDTLYIQF